MDLISKAKALQAAKAEAASNLTNTVPDFDISTLDEKSTYMRMSMLCDVLSHYLIGTSYVKFSSLFKVRGLCHRSNIQLQESMLNRTQLLELKRQLHNILECICHIEAIGGAQTPIDSTPTQDGQHEQ